MHNNLAKMSHLVREKQVLKTLSDGKTRFTNFRNTGDGRIILPHKLCTLMRLRHRMIQSSYLSKYNKLNLKQKKIFKTIIVLNIHHRMALRKQKII